MSRTFRRLLVAGAAGFIGSNFVRHLRRERPAIEIIVLDKLTYAGNLANLLEFEGRPGYRFVHGDICDSGLVDSLAVECDAIVNFAAETHVDRSLMDPLAFIDTDVRGTAVLCEAARRHEHQAFLLVSTDEVYGHVGEGRSVESDPFRPRSPYSASKAGGEHLAHAYAESFGLPLLVTRGSNNYGPYQYPEKLIPVLITNSRSIKTVRQSGTSSTSTTTAGRSTLCCTKHRRGAFTTSAQAPRQAGCRLRKRCSTSWASPAP